MENTGQVPAPFPNMNRLDDILVLTPQFSPIEARLTVLTSVRSPDSELLPAREKPALRVAGWVNGPLCEYAETLRQRTSLKQESPSTESKAFRSQALILEPCFWEPEHPFCYELAIELYEGSEIRDRRRMLIVIRHLQVRGRQLLFNGKPYFVQGTRRSSPA